MASTMRGILTISAEDCNGLMGLQIISDNLINEPTIQIGEQTVEFDFHYGTPLHFISCGKNMNSDTIVHNGKIIKDKHILIKKIQLGFIEIENWMLHKYFFDPYFGRNETKIIHVPKYADMLLWWLKLNKV